MRRNMESEFVVRVLGCLLAVLPLVESQGFEETAFYHKQKIPSKYDDDSYDAEFMYNLEMQRAEQFVVGHMSKPFALLSMICSSVMMREVLNNKSRSAAFNRLLGSLGFSTFILSFGSFLGPQLCTLQGFCIQLGWVSTVLSTSALSFYCMWVVRCGWTDEEWVQMETKVFAFVWLYSFVAAGYLIPLDLYNSSVGVCYIQSIPANCGGDTECIRGINPVPHRMLTSFVTAVGTFFCISVGVVSYWKLQEIKGSQLEAGDEDDDEEEAMLDNDDLNDSVHEDDRSLESGSVIGHRLSQSGDESMSALGREVMKRLSMESSVRSLESMMVIKTVDKKTTQRVAVRAINYAAAFLVTFLFWFVSEAVTLGIDPSVDTFYFLGFLIFVPSGGTFYFLVFAKRRPRMRTCEGRLLRKLLFCYFCPGCNNSNSNNGEEKHTKFWSRRRLSRDVTIDTAAENISPMKDDYGDDIALRAAGNGSLRGDDFLDGSIRFGSSRSSRHLELQQPDQRRGSFFNDHGKRFRSASKVAMEALPDAEDEVNNESKDEASRAVETASKKWRFQPTFDRRVGDERTSEMEDTSEMQNLDEEWMSEVMDDGGFI